MLGVYYYSNEYQRKQLDSIVESGGIVTQARYRGSKVELIAEFKEHSVYYVISETKSTSSRIS